MRLILTRLISAAVIGAVVGLAIGFTVHDLSGGYVSFRSWIHVTASVGSYNPIYWLLSGVIVAVAAVFLIHPPIT
jgi:UPF0716 family protein affecting phage T7 exclusion